MKRSLHVFALLLALTPCRAAKTQELARRSTLGASVAENPAGLRVMAVTRGSPASVAGLEVDDIITEVDGHKVSAPQAFLEAVRVARPGQPIALHLIRGGSVMILHPQPISAPQEVDPFVDTFYSSVAVEGSLRRTLITVPKGVSGKLPAMLLIGGIGCFSIDNPLDRYDPYRPLAHDLSRAGIIVMRLEKAGIGDSQGGPCFDTGFQQESTSYQAAWAALLANSRVDAKAVFLFGHSIGTLIAPRLALGKEVAGVIAADGVGINWFEYELANLRRQAELDGDTPDQTDALLASKETCMHRLLLEHEDEKKIETDLPECKKRNAYPVAAAYLQQVAALNIAEPWTRIDAPVLAIHGSADFVTAESDHRRIVAIVNRHHPGLAELQTIVGMDHHFATMGTPQQAYDARVKQHGQGPYANELSKVVSAWICSKADCSQMPSDKRPQEQR